MSACTLQVLIAVVWSGDLAKGRCPTDASHIAVIPARAYGNQHYFGSQQMGL